MEVLKLCQFDNISKDNNDNAKTIGLIHKYLQVMVGKNANFRLWVACSGAEGDRKAISLPKKIKLFHEISSIYFFYVHEIIIFYPCHKKM